jgi:hypothetical protein
VGGEELATLLCRLAARPLTPSAVEDMENIRTSARRAIVDEVFSCGKAFHPSSDVLRGSSCIGMFSEQPEPPNLPQETRMSILDIQIEPKKKAATLVAALRFTVT